MNPGFETVIGLEVHVQLRTASKMFCACRNAFGAEPNTQTCPVCLGLPGTLPVLNREAVRMAVMLGLALEANVRDTSTFYRKQYFYPDLPKGYQITQGPLPIVEGGEVEIPGDPDVRGSLGPVRIRIERAHLEEDAGKSSHEWSATRSHVDLNRAGVPLLEIVGAPDLRSPQEAFDCMKALHRMVVFLGICDGNMEEGSLRCDANISIRANGSVLFGRRVEVKNLNSFRNVKLALEYEVQRQSRRVEQGLEVEQETRGWDAVRGETVPQRSKEAAMDYRYFPEPDLPPLVVRPEEVDGIRQTMPELPQARARRFKQAYGLGDDEVQTLLQSRSFAAWFEALAEASGHGTQAANWMLGEVSRVLNQRGIAIEALPLAPEALGGLLRLVEARTITLGTAREIVFPALLAGEGTAEAIVAARGLAQVKDRAALESLVQDVLSAHPAQVAQLRAGKENLKGFLVGQILKAGAGKLDPRQVNEVLAEALAKA
jgi:aspartyl-tRNA(Asn)/glutamyl-tRNA(Gln) amidotransferase subunit B